MPSPLFWYSAFDTIGTCDIVLSNASIKEGRLFSRLGKSSIRLFSITTVRTDTTTMLISQPQSVDLWMRTLN